MKNQVNVAYVTVLAVYLVCSAQASDESLDLQKSSALTASAVEVTSAIQVSNAKEQVHSTSSSSAAAAASYEDVGILYDEEQYEIDNKRVMQEVAKNRLKREAEFDFYLDETLAELLSATKSEHTEKIKKLVTRVLDIQKSFLSLHVISQLARFLETISQNGVSVDNRSLVINVILDGLERYNFETSALEKKHAIIDVVLKVIASKVEFRVEDTIDWSCRLLSIMQSEEKGIVVKFLLKKAQENREADHVIAYTLAVMRYASEAKSEVIGLLLYKIGAETEVHHVIKYADAIVGYAPEEAPTVAQFLFDRARIENDASRTILYVDTIMRHVPKAEPDIRKLLFDKIHSEYKAGNVSGYAYTVIRYAAEVKFDVAERLLEKAEQDNSAHNVITYVDAIMSYIPEKKFDVLRLLLKKARKASISDQSIFSSKISSLFCDIEEIPEILLQEMASVIPEFSVKLDKRNAVIFARGMAYDQYYGRKRGFPPYSVVFGIVYCLGAQKEAMSVFNKITPVLLRRDRDCIIRKSLRNVIPDFEKKALFAWSLPSFDKVRDSVSFQQWFAKSYIPSLLCSPEEVLYVDTKWQSYADDRSVFYAEQGRDNLFMSFDDWKRAKASLLK